MAEYNIEEVRELWKQEPDKVVFKAATEDLSEYPLEIQAIIQAEATKRDFPEKNLEGLNVKVKKKKNAKSYKLKAETQLRIGLICACCILAYGVYNFIRGQVFHASIAELSGYLTTMGTLSIYVIALVKRKIRAVQIVYRVWVVLVGLECTLICIAILLAGKWSESLVSLVTVLFICAVIFIPYLIVIYILRIGLCGLTRIIENQKTSKNNA